eukprot:g3882.t1
MIHQDMSPSFPTAKTPSPSSELDVAENSGKGLTTTGRVERWMSRLDLSTNRAVEESPVVSTSDGRKRAWSLNSDKANTHGEVFPSEPHVEEVVENIVDIEVSPVDGICDTVAEALVRLNETAHALDESFADVESMSVSSARTDSKHSWASSSFSERRPPRTREGTSASDRSYRDMDKDELIEVVEEKCNELASHREVNRQLSERLASTQVNDTLLELELVRTPKDAVAYAAREAAMMAAHKTQVRKLERRHAAYVREIKMAMKQKGEIRHLKFRKQLAQELRIFQKRHERIVTKHIETLTVAVARMKRAEAALEKHGIRATTVEHAVPLPRRTPSPSALDSALRCCVGKSVAKKNGSGNSGVQRRHAGAELDGFEDINLENEIVVILNERYDWKGPQAAAVKAIAMDVLADLCRTPDFQSLAVLRGKSMNNAELSLGDVKTPGTTPGSSPRRHSKGESFVTPDQGTSRANAISSAHSSIINEEIREYPPELRALFTESGEKSAAEGP